MVSFLRIMREKDKDGEKWIDLEYKREESKNTKGRNPISNW